MATAEISIDIRNVSKTYNWGRLRALDNVTLSVKQGEIFGLIGPNGAGKTTLMGCLLAALRPTSGTITINGKAADDLSVRRITAFLPERPNFDAWMKVHEFLHYHLLLSGRPYKNAKEEVARALDAVGLESPVSKRTVKQLSRGMLQRLGLAQALIGQPKLCFLDEPTSGMDPLGMALVRDLLTEWKKEGVTVILNSHHLDEVERVCDRVAFIKAGKIETLEALSIDSMQKIALTVRWPETQRQEQIDKIPELAKTLNLELEERGQGWAKFKLPDRQAASALIRTLVQNDILVEEAVLERKNLQELFIDAKRAVDQGGI
jgi:ABC-2 type transport system ATP-binding protein